jgi:flavodoxin I
MYIKQKVDNMDKIALLYAPAKGSTEKVARLLQNKIGPEKIDIIQIEENTSTSILNTYSKIIFGISTVGRDSWDSKYIKIAWDFFLPKLEKVDLKGKTVAIFGLGDHILYTNNFVDSMGALANTLVKCGVNLIGKTSVDGYKFNDSSAIIDEMFVGLPIDEDNEPELTDQRLNTWILNISKPLGI